jgi:peptide/nickel transport system substrate-binding protein
MRDQEGLTRDQFLRGAAAGGLAVGLGGVLAGCDIGGGDSGAPQPATGPPRRGGQFTAAYGNGGGQTASLDPDTSIHYWPDLAGQQALYDRLTTRNDDFELGNSLAEEVTSDAKAEVWTIRLKQGVEFHNGKTIDADDVLASIRRKLNLKASTSAPVWALTDPKGLKKIDKRTVSVRMLRPNAVFPSSLAQYTGYITPVGFDPRRPVGTGPFKFVSFSPGRETVLERFENYFGTGPYFDRVRILDVPDETARVNSLLSGQVDAIQGVPASQLAAVKSRGKVELISKAGAWLPISMRVDTAPFNDPRVRQAMRLIADREEMVTAALGGQGRLGNDLYGILDPGYDSELPQRTQDIEQAKSLLKQAGHEGLTVQMTAAPVATGVMPAVQVLARQAKDAGVTVNIRQMTPADYYGSEFLNYPFDVDNWQGGAYLDLAALADGPGAPYNQTHWNDKQFTDLYYGALAELDENRRKQTLHDMQRIQYDRGGYLIWGLPNYLDASSPKVAGLGPLKQAIYPLRNLELNRAWFTES